MLGAKLAELAAEHAGTVEALTVAQRALELQLTDAVGLAERLTARESEAGLRLEAVAHQDRLMKRQIAEFEAKAELLSATESALAEAEQRLRLLEAEEGGGTYLRAVCF